MLSYLRKLPAAARFFLAVEFSERASYYGYRSLLTAYLTFHLGLTAHQAAQITRSNIALTYLMPVVGGIVADWFLGKYLTIVAFALICCLGHLLLAVSMHFDQFSILHGLFADGFSVFQTGLFCIACGAGGLKPNNSGMFGDQFRGDRQGQIEDAFRWFYASINVGSLLANVFVPVVANHWSYDWGFGVPGILMLLSTLLLVWGRRQYFTVPPNGLPKTTFVTFNLRALWLQIRGVPDVWNALALEYGKTTVEHLLSIWRVGAYFLLFAVLWAVYDMNGAEWVEEARYLDRRMFGYEVNFESVQTVNSLFIILLVPVSIWFFRRLSDRGIRVSARRRVFWGMIFAVAAVLGAGIIKTGIEAWMDLNPAMRNPLYAQEHPEICSGISVWWQVAVYFILTVGEVLFSISGLELGYRYAPPRMKSSVLSVWYLSTSLGNYVAAAVKSQMDAGEPLAFLARSGNYYWFFGALLIANAALYLRLSPMIPEKIYDAGE